MKMLKREREHRQAIEMLRVDMLAPKEHLLRKSDAAVDFTRIYALVEALYCEDNGRPSCAPVVLFKLVLIQRLHSLSAILSYATTNREGYREYKSKSYICKNCPVRKRCTQSQQRVKTVTQHIRRSAKRPTPCDPKRLSAYLPTRRKSTRCVIRLTEADRRYHMGQAQICRDEFEKARHLQMDAPAVFLHFLYT